MDDVDDDLEWEEFMSMSDSQTDAMLDRMMKEHSARLDALSPLQLYRYRRSTRLELCGKQRRLEREFPEIFTPMRRATQRRLLEARMEFWHGSTAGHS